MRLSVYHSVRSLPVRQRETARLNQLIDHSALWIGRTNMTALVIEALKNFVGERQR